MGEFILESIELKRDPAVIAKDKAVAYIERDERLELKVNFLAIGDTREITNEMLFKVFHEKLMSMLEDEKYLKL